MRRLVFLFNYSYFQPCELVLKGCDALLSIVTHADMTKTILPAVTRGLLRTPEAVLSSLIHLAIGLQIDSSAYLKDISKLLQGEDLELTLSLCCDLVSDICIT